MGLSFDEDAELRRLASFDRPGFLELRGRTRLADLRGRDRRTDVRPVTEPVEHFTVIGPGGRRMRGARCLVYPA